MRLDNLENDEVFSAAIKGLPKVVQLIAVVPEEKRSHALAVARQAYLRTARELGYEESDAQQWASMVMSFWRSPPQRASWQQRIWPRSMRPNA
jgi:hypothetical protein